MNINPTADINPYRVDDIPLAQDSDANIGYPGIVGYPFSYS